MRTYKDIIDPNNTNGAFDINQNGQFKIRYRLLNIHRLNSVEFIEFVKQTTSCLLGVADTDFADVKINVSDHVFSSMNNPYAPPVLIDVQIQSVFSTCLDNVIKVSTDFNGIEGDIHEFNLKNPAKTKSMVLLDNIMAATAMLGSIDQYFKINLELFSPNESKYYRFNWTKDDDDGSVSIQSNYYSDIEYQYYEAFDAMLPALEGDLTVDTDFTFIEYNELARN